jgi:hypothetical protein
MNMIADATLKDPRDSELIRKKRKLDDHAGIACFHQIFQKCQNFLIFCTDTIGSSKMSTDIYRERHTKKSKNM